MTACEVKVLPNVICKLGLKKITRLHSNSVCVHQILFESMQNFYRNLRHTKTWFWKRNNSQTQIYDWFLKSSAEDDEYSSLWWKCGIAPLKRTKCEQPFLQRCSAASPTFMVKMFIKLAYWRFVSWSYKCCCSLCFVCAWLSSKKLCDCCLPPRSRSV